METQFANLGMNVERLRAVEPETIEDEDLAPLSMEEACKNMSPVEVAASSSHFRAWRRMLAAGQRRVLVLEDDARLSSLMPSFLAAIEAQGVDFGVLRLETRLSKVLVQARGQPGPLGISLHVPLSYEVGSAAYVITADDAARILAAPDRFVLPIDDILFSLESPFHDLSRLRVTVPALALCEHEISPQYSVPESILASDTQAGRDMREAEQRRHRPKGLAKLLREVRRLLRQIGSIPEVVGRVPEVVWLRLHAVRTTVPFADGAVSAPPSAAPRRG